MYIFYYVAKYKRKYKVNAPVAGQVPVAGQSPLFYSNLGGGQNLERRIANETKFRNFKISNIKITKDVLFDSFINDFFFFF